jgi:TniQ
MAVLSLAPPPLPGELLASWIGRLACLYDAPSDLLWHELAGALAVELAPFGHHQPGGDGLREQFARIAIATRLEVGAVAATAMRVMLPAAPVRWLRSEIVSTYRVPWCPPCLRDDVTHHRPPYLRRLWAAGCVVICPRHRAALVDTCPGCQRRTRAVFRWEGRGPVLVCTACEALLHDYATGSSSAAGNGPTGSVAGDCLSAAIAGASWLQAKLLRALGGHPVAVCRDAAPARTLPIVEALVGYLLFPLGIVRDVGWPATGPKGMPPRCSTTGLSARDAFAVAAAVAALLALPDEELDDRFEGALWRQRTLGEPIDLSRLWLRPDDGGGVLRCDRQHVFTASQDIGVAVALTVLGDPVIAAYLAARRRVAVPPSGATPPPRATPPPEADDRFLQMAQRILTDPANVVRLAAARTPAVRRRLLGRLAREALEAAELPATSTRAGHARVPGRAAL